MEQGIGSRKVMASNCSDTQNGLREQCQKDHAYQGVRQGAFKTLAQYSKRFRETLKMYKATGRQADSVVVKDTELAMGIFTG